MFLFGTEKKRVSFAQVICFPVQAQFQLSFEDVSQVLSFVGIFPVSMAAGLYYMNVYLQQPLARMGERPSRTISVPERMVETFR